MWSKRRYTFNTIVGSVSGAVTPLIGWSATEPNISLIPSVLFLILFIWQMPHTFAIAMKKYKEYKAAGVAMLPVVYGFKITKWQMIFYIVCLFPSSFYLISLGNTFVIIMSLLNIVWLILGILGFYMKNNLKWAHMMFIYSVNYIMIAFLLMVIVTL